MDNNTISAMLERLIRALENKPTDGMSDQEIGDHRRLITEAENMVFDLQANS